MSEHVLTVLRTDKLSDVRNLWKESGMCGWVAEGESEMPHLIL